MCVHVCHVLLLSLPRMGSVAYPQEELASQSIPDGNIGCVCSALALDSRYLDSKYAASTRDVLQPNLGCRHIDCIQLSSTKYRTCDLLYRNMHLPELLASLGAVAGDGTAPKHSHPQIAL